MSHTQHPCPLPLFHLERWQARGNRGFGRAHFPSVCETERRPPPSVPPPREGVYSTHLAVGKGGKVDICSATGNGVFCLPPPPYCATVSPLWCRRRRRAFSVSASLPLLRKLLPAGLGLPLPPFLIAPLLVPSPILCPPPPPRDIKYSRPSRKNAFLPPFLLRERMIPPSYPLLHTARKKGCPSP